jgi:hypothetical protein
MPYYHIHFREDMGSVITDLNQARTAAGKEAGGEEAGKRVKDACRTFRYCMQHLQGHVNIEERSYFPSLQRQYMVHTDCLPIFAAVDPCAASLAPNRDKC